MADVGRVTPGKPIWPGHHGEVPVVPATKEEEKEKRRPPERERNESAESPPPGETGSGHLDEYA